MGPGIRRETTLAGLLDLAVNAEMTLYASGFKYSPQTPKAPAGAGAFGDDGGTFQDNQPSMVVTGLRNLASNSLRVNCRNGAAEATANEWYCSGLRA